MGENGEKKKGGRYIKNTYNVYVLEACTCTRMTLERESGSETAANNFWHPFSHFKSTCTVWQSPHIVHRCVCARARVLTSPVWKRLYWCVFCWAVCTHVYHYIRCVYVLSVATGHLSISSSLSWRVPDIWVSFELPRSRRNSGPETHLWEHNGECSVGIEPTGHWVSLSLCWL